MELHLLADNCILLKQTDTNVFLKSDCFEYRGHGIDSTFLQEIKNAIKCYIFYLLVQRNRQKNVHINKVMKTLMSLDAIAHYSRTK